METLGPLLVKFWVLICLQTDLIQLLELEFSLLSCLVIIHVACLCCPISFVLDLHRQMTSFSKDDPKGRHPNRCFIGCTMGRNGIVKTFTPILPVGLTIFSKMRFISQLETSAWPFVCEWYGVDALWITPYFLNRPSSNLLQKCVPWSLMIALGIPNLQKRLERIKVATTWESLVLVAIASTHLET